jgi:tight adherence protein C
MTFLLFAMGLILVAVSGRLLVRAIAIPRLRLKVHLRDIQDYGFESISEERDVSASKRFKRRLRALAETLGRTMMARFPSLSALGPGDLTAAGFYEISPEAIHGFRLMAGTGLPTLIGLLLFAGGGKLSFMPLLLLITSAAAGWQAPSFIIRKRGSARLEEIDHGLPELIDLLIATVEAGMGFSASLSLVSERFHGPIGEELKLTMKQQSLGISIQQALDDMVERCDTPSIRSFVRTASRGESLGVSIGPVLRELSADQRRRYRQTAREKMQKAPIKMLFPLMFLIFPALMIVLMYPAAYSVAHNLSGVFGG